MIYGAHVMLQSKDAAADLAFLREVMQRPKVVDAGGGWLIYALPPAEIAVHPAGENDVHKLYLMCDSIEDFRRDMAARGTPCGDVQTQRWGLLVDVTMPGGGKLGVYEPRHASPHPRTPAKPRAKAARKVAKKAAPAKKKATPAKKRAAKKAGRGKR
jgi:hypothetical protein